MKNIFSKNSKVYFFAVGFWVLLFVLSALLIDPTTGQPRMDIYLFHFVMFIISLLILYPLFKYFKRKTWIENSTFMTFFLVNVLLDFLILIPFFGVSIKEWLIFILPSYILGTGIVYKLFK